MDPDPLSFLAYITPDFSSAVFDYLLTALAILLIIVNAIISGSEIAFFTIDKNFTEQVHSSEGPASVRISRLLSNPEKFSASLVIAYNFLNVTIAVLILYLLNRLSWFSGSPADSLLLEFIIPISIILLFVDILPKRAASYNPFRFATRNAQLITVIYGIASPFSSLLVRGTNLFNSSVTQSRHEISVDDLSKALEITSSEIAHGQEKEMLEGIIRFKDKVVDDILVSRSDMVAIDSQTSFDEVIKFIVEAGFSRIPVYEENADNIKGILYVKDLLPHLDKKETFKWQMLIRSAYFVPGTKRIDDLLEEFRAEKNHMAIVVDEYGGTSGLVTMEDILEEIVGDISDEYDEELPFYTMAADGSYIFEGKTPLDEFIKITGLPEKDFEQMQDEIDTLAGLLLELKGDFPKRKESFTYNKHTFQAEEMSKKRITKVRYIPPKN
ncbi:MAG: gliding motility-associated protein GldE [Porphyromonadaceae bacterium]|nr:gliding motility-associated protein GldE [Porphyromonadaceae bacterium]